MNAKFVALAVIALTLADPAFAIERQQIGARSCSEVQSLVRAQGAVILQYAGRSGLKLYERAVANSDKCFGSGYGEQTYVPTKDRRDCAVWVCRPSTDLRP